VYNNICKCIKVHNDRLFIRSFDIDTYGDWMERLITVRWKEMTETEDRISKIRVEVEAMNKIDNLFGVVICTHKDDDEDDKDLDTFGYVRMSETTFYTIFRIIPEEGLTLDITINDLTARYLEGPL